MKAVVSVIGRDSVGIIAKVSAGCAECGANILEGARFCANCEASVRATPTASNSLSALSSYDVAQSSRLSSESSFLASVSAT